MRALFRGLVVLAVYVGLGGGLTGAQPVLAQADPGISAAIQQVIQHSNDEQVQAIAAKDASLMADTVTSDHYQELVQVNQDLLNSGVASISLVKLDWGAIAVDSSGASATATTYETWRTVYVDGTSDQSRDRNDYGLVLDTTATWRISSDSHPDQNQSGGQPDPNVGIPPQISPFPFPFPNPNPNPNPESQNTSHNWSGYAATGGTYTAVNGTWAVPQFAADGSFGIDAAWVGIGGVRSRDLIQAGTQQTVSGTGNTRYEAWLEMLPGASRPVPLSIHPGDSVSVSIAEQSTDQWEIDFTNNTTGKTYSTTEPYHSTHGSAEWVEEAPSGGRGGVLPLDNFGSIDFSDGSAVKDGQSVTISSANATPITMVGGTNQALAVPTPLTADGAGFTVARTGVPATTVTPRRGGGGFQLVPPGLTGQ